jgi:hypothetical protein
MNTEKTVVQEVLERVLVSGLVPIDEATWAIYGSIPVDGQVIVAEFDDRAVAESALERIAAEQEMVAPRPRDVRVEVFAGRWTARRL